VLPGIGANQDQILRALAQNEENARRRYSE
jgi:hypothetical protein